MTIKIFICKLCGFKGIRKEVRLHLRKVHWIRGLSKGADGKRLDSMITENTTYKDFEGIKKE